MLGFFIAFIVRLPAFPFHPWLPDAHTEAPTAGSVILAGLLLKTGAYGLLRFVLPLFPGAAATIAPWAMILAAVSIIYGALLAFAQTDLKRLVAYTSVSHMGFVLLGIFAGTMTALSGAVMQIVAHGVSTGALFIIVGMIQQRIHTRDMERMGGFWSSAPRLSGIALVFALASLGLPGFGNFVAEFMVLLGTYQAHVWITVVAASGLVLAAIYSLWIVQRVFHGEEKDSMKLVDLSSREAWMMAAMVVVILWLGMFPRPVLDTVAPALEAIRNSSAHTITIAPGGAHQ
jgi:NADH-quinone oxidoreductase subunit M